VTDPPARRPVCCPICNRRLAETDGLTLFLSVSSYSRSKVVLHCLAPGCPGRWAWYPPPERRGW
jgi:hypothetical protein